MHSQLPDYDDFQCYDLGIDGALSQISQKDICQFVQAIVTNVETSLIYGKKSQRSFLSSSEILRKAIAGRLQTGKDV